jgi:organic hydroperoxide reductase OsmC/OhrA
MRPKQFEFPVDVDWVGGKRVVAHAPDKHTIDVATPPEFGSGIERVWSPEDFLVGSVGTCFAVTLVAIAERRGIPLHGLRVAGTGRVGPAERGLGFTGIELDVAVETEPEHVQALRDACARAEQACLVSNALAIPVELTADVRPVAGVVPA